MTLLIDVGLGNTVALGRIVSMVAADSASSRRIVKAAEERGLLIDSTGGRRTRSVLVMDTGHVVLSFLSRKALRERVGRLTSFERILKQRIAKDREVLLALAEG